MPTHASSTPPDVSDEAAFTKWCQTVATARATTAEYIVDSEHPLTLAAKVGTNDMRVSLDVPWQLCQQDAKQCDEFTRNWLDSMVRTVEAPAAAPERAQIRPAIRTADYLEQMRTHGGVDPIAEELIAGLWVLYVVDTPDTARALQRGELAELAGDIGELRKIAIANLEREIGAPATLVKDVPANGIGFVTVQNYYNSSLVLLHPGWRSVSEKLGGQLLVSMPTPETLLYTDGRGKDALVAISTVARDMASKAPNSLFPGVLRWTKTGWEVVAPP